MTEGRRRFMSQARLQPCVSKLQSYVSKLQPSPRVQPTAFYNQLGALLLLVRQHPLPDDLGLELQAAALDGPLHRRLHL